MKILIWMSLVVLTFFLLVNTAFGGLAIFKGNVELFPFEKKTVCGVCIYSTLPQKGRFSLEFSENLKKFVEKIYPNDFELQPIECPMEPEPRRACINTECSNPNSTSSKLICVDFKGPFELSLFPKRTEYRGAVRGVEKVGASVLVIPTDFIVYYTPFNAWLIGIPVVIVCISIGILLMRKRKLRKEMEK
jgi:hypothetical protein